MRVLIKTHDSKDVSEKSVKGNDMNINCETEHSRVELENTFNQTQNSSNTQMLSYSAASGKNVSNLYQLFDDIISTIEFPGISQINSVPTVSKIENRVCANHDEILLINPAIAEKSTAPHEIFPVVANTEIISGKHEKLSYTVSKTNVDTAIKNCELILVDSEVEAEAIVTSKVACKTFAGHDNVPKHSLRKNESTIVTNSSHPALVPDCITLSSSSEISVSSLDDDSEISEESEVDNDSKPVDIRKIIVPQSKNLDKRTTKKYFCPFCNKLQSKFARHLELMHYSEVDVHKFIKLPKGNSERKKIIETIRKNGNYIHNTHPEHNTGILITCRQQGNNKNSAEDYVCCKSCKGFFSKRTLRLHYRTCDKNYQKGAKQMMVKGRMLTGYIHPRAYKVLRRKVFPVLRDDVVTRLIKYDQLIITFGNELCSYLCIEQHDIVRSNLRLLGRFLMIVKEKDKNITDLSSVFQAKFLDTVLEGIKACANYNADIKMFQSPSVATTIVTLLKYCLKMHISECIEIKNERIKKDAEDFLILFEEATDKIKTKVLGDRFHNIKTAKISTIRNISKLLLFLENNMSNAYDFLKNSFNLESYNMLAESTLVFIYILNRSRAGEIQRILISDFNNQKELYKCPNFKHVYPQLSAKHQPYVKTFITITIRGKLGRNVPVLINTFIVKCMEVIIAWRHSAGISSTNKYVFGKPDKDRYEKNYLPVYPLVRKFSEQCGINMPRSLQVPKVGIILPTYTAMQMMILFMEWQERSDPTNVIGDHKGIDHVNDKMIPILQKMVNTLEKDNMTKDDYDKKSRNIETSNQAIRIISQSENKSVKTSSKNSQLCVSNDWTNQEVRSAICSETTKMKSTHRRSTSPLDKIKHVRWNKEEKAAITNFFGDLSKLSKLPSVIQCIEVKLIYDALERRTPRQIKTWIENQRNVKIRVEAYKHKLRGTKKTNDL